VANLVTRRRIGLAAGLGAFALVVFLFRTSDDAAAKPHTPASDTEILERLPKGSSDPRSRELTKLRQTLAESPTNLPLAVEVARRNVQESRSRADPRYLGYAQSALAPWWDEPSPPTEVLLLRATIRQSTHDFDAALRDLDLLVRETPNDAQAWVTRAVVLTVRGEYDEARASCAPLPALAGRLVAAICNANIDGVSGDAQGAFARLSAALGARSPFDRAGEAETEWATSTLGEIATRTGDLSAAEQYFTKALALDPTDTYSLAAWADLLLDEGRAPEVATRLAGTENNDGLLLRLALAEAAAHLKAADAHRDLIRSRFDASHARGDVVHRREEARFVLALEHDPRRALDLAIANWGVQKEPWDVRVYVESAAAAHDPVAARPVLEWLDRTHLQDPMIAKAAAALRGAP
jgi:Flp pilus assembly protein TadD